MIHPMPSPPRLTPEVCVCVCDEHTKRETEKVKVAPTHPPNGGGGDGVVGVSHTGPIGSFHGDAEVLRPRHYHHPTHTTSHLPMLPRA
jgi:hypothetical protein